MYFWVRHFNKTLYVADPAIFLASNCVLGTLLSSESSLFSYGGKKLIFLNMNFFSITTWCYFKQIFFSH